MLTCALQGVGANHLTKYEQDAARRDRVEGLLRALYICMYNMYSVYFTYSTQYFN